MRQHPPTDATAQPVSSLLRILSIVVPAFFVGACTTATQPVADAGLPASAAPGAGRYLDPAAAAAMLPDRIAIVEETLTRNPGEPPVIGMTFRNLRFRETLSFEVRALFRSRSGEPSDVTEWSPVSIAPQKDYVYRAASSRQESVTAEVQLRWPAP